MTEKDINENEEESLEHLPDLERSKTIMFGMLEASLPVLKTARGLATTSQDPNMIGAYTGLLHKMGVLAGQIISMNKKDEETKRLASGGSKKPEDNDSQVMDATALQTMLEENEDIVPITKNQP